VFDPRRWAEAFTELCGGDTEGLRIFKVLIAALERVSSPSLGGTEDARKLEAAFRASLLEAGFFQTGNGFQGELPASGLPVSGENRAAELAVRFLSLLVRRGLFKYRKPLLAELEKAEDRAGGVTRARLESAEEVTADFEKELERELLKKTGARKVFLEAETKPELLAGFRLFIGSDVFDTSLRERLRTMRRDLS
jgi:hypothetical protein